MYDSVTPTATAVSALMLEIEIYSSVNGVHSNRDIVVIVSRCGRSKRGTWSVYVRARGHTFQASAGTVYFCLYVTITI